MRWFKSGRYEFGYGEPVLYLLPDASKALTSRRARIVRGNCKMTKYLIIAIFFLTACSSNNKNNQTNDLITDSANQTVSETYKPADNPKYNIKSDLFEIANIDYHGDWLQRIFVVIQPDKVNDTAIIRQTICTLKKSYPLNNKSNISFFSDKKYANYKTVLFMDGKNLLPQTEYKNWIDSYYLGEYEFETSQYKTFPVSSKTDRQKVYRLNGYR